MNELAPFPRAQLDLGFARRGARTFLDRRLYTWPYVLSRAFHLDAAPAHMLTLIIQTSSGALHGEDRLAQRFHLSEGSAVHLTTQGATLVHRAHPGATGVERTTISVDEGAFVEYLPEPRVLFPGAALDQSLDISCAPGAMAIVSDAFTFHDPAGGEGTFRELRSATTLRGPDGTPLLVDRLCLTRPLEGRLAAMRAFGTIWLFARLPEDKLQTGARDLSQALAAIAGLYAAASFLPGSAGIGVRLAGRDMQCLRSALDLAWRTFRRLLIGQAPAPRRKCG